MISSSNRTQKQMSPYLLSIALALPLYFFLHRTSSTLPINSPGLYSQQFEHVAVNCGSSGNSIAEDTRQWTGDTGSNYITSLHGSKSELISSKATDQVLPNDPIPYAMVRLSRWPFTYTFRVTPGQKLIRLHFYPASYQGGFKRSKAFFSVKAGPYTLLSNFSASHTVDALGLQYLVKEYCVNVEEDQQLILTFSPSQSGNSNEVYAFVNGIEIISMPAALYHTREGTPAAQIIGKSNRFTIDKSIALEKVHRLNVGGSSISSIEDTGMFRDWDEDSNYLLEKSTIKSATTTIRIKYTSIPPYTAPQTVYQTSWLLVPDKQANKNEFNFTWRLPVDLGFRYLLRLHFCELEYEIKESVRKEFSLFVNEQVVEAKGDLIKWSGGNGVVVYRDYVVLMEGDRMEGKHDLLIVLRPHKHEWMEPIDATLKGLEVFKLNNPDKNLAGVNPVLLATRALISQKPKKIVFASGGNAIATGVVILLTVLNVIVYQLCRLGENNVERNLASSTSEGMCRCFSLAELISVTNNFDDELVIGSGGFGKVYKAIIDDGATTVALKRLNLKSKQGEKEFWTEIEMLSKLRHTHLVSLLGYCDERNEMILVYEFMEHGTLADHLYKIKPNGNGIVGHLSWEQRLIICIGAARGLDYLHTGTEHGIIHRDVKTTNILLGKDWIAKISDFGLCKLGSTSHSHTHVSTDVKGSFGYFDPEYFLTCRLTKKSDVYAFGVMMLEMLCGRPAVDMQVEEEQCSLVLWAKPVIKENKLDLLLDPSLRDEILPHCLKVFVEVAYNCLDSRPKGRPTMADVVARLEGALASVNQFMVPSTEKEDDHDFSVGRAVDGQFGEIVQMDDSLPRCDAPSSSTPALYSENTQGQKQSKGNVSKVFQITIEFLAKGANINQKKRKKGFRPHTCNQESSSSTPARDCAPKTIVFSLPLSPAGQLIRCSATSTDRHHQHHHPSPMRQPTLMGHAQIHYGGSRHRSRRPHLSGSRSSPTFTEGYHMLLHDSRGKQPLLAHRSPRLRPNNEAYLKGKILPTPNLRIFSFSELKTATHNFGEDRLLGEGSSGKVYKGWLDEKNGSSLVFAAKKMDAEGFQGFKEWQTEVNLLGMFSHPNLVKLLGYCREKKELLHVYEFMPKGSLDDHLFGRGSSVQPLSWDIRLHILIGAARGMDFLHTSEKQVIYRDFKTSNILLDESYNAKMTNFGWARLGPPVSETHLTTQVVGTHGYAAPEYVATGHLNIKSDVYGYGVVLIEMLTGLRAVDKNRPSAKHSLVEWVKPYLPQKRKLVNIMDSRLEGKYPSKAAFQIAQLALKCLGPYPKTRPSMKEVVETLEAIDASNE